MAKGKGEIKGWITKNGVHIPIYGQYTVRGGVEPKAKGAKWGKKKKRKELRDAIESKEIRAFGALKNDDNYEDVESDLGDRLENAKSISYASPKGYDAGYKVTYQDGTIKVFGKNFHQGVKEVQSKSDTGKGKRVEGKYANRDWNKDVEDSKRYGYSEQTEEGKKPATKAEEKSSKPDFSKMSYSEAGQYVSEHKKDFGLSEGEDAYLAAYEMKNGTWKDKTAGQESSAKDYSKTSSGGASEWENFSDAQVMDYAQDEHYKESATKEMQARGISSRDYQNYKNSKTSSKSEFGQKTNDDISAYQDKYLRKRSDSELKEMQSNLNKSTSIAGTSQGDMVAQAAIERELASRGTSKSGEGSSKPDFSKMSYSEAGKHVAANKSKYGLKDSDDVYLAASQMKNGTWKGDSTVQENRKWADDTNRKTMVDSPESSTSKANKTDAYNDKVFADFKKNGKDYQRVPMEGYAGTANDFRAAAKRAGVEIEYDKGDDTFYLRKPKQEPAIKKTSSTELQSRINKAKNDSAARQERNAAIKETLPTTVSGLRSAYSEATGREKAVIGSELRRKGYSYIGGRWIKA